MNASTVQRPRHAARRAVGALCALLVLLSATAPGVRADSPPDQEISFTSTAPSAAVVGGATYTPTATATSGLPVTFTIDASASSVCSISGADVSFTGVGTCVIDADQAGDITWAPAPRVTQSFAVGPGSQAISFTSTAPSAAVVGGATYTPTATGGASGNPVTFTIDASASSVCSISGADVSFTGVGTCVIDADQAGDANYDAAPQVQQTFAVGTASLSSQEISFTSTAPSAAMVGGATYTPTATATSGLPVTFTIDSSAASVCTISGGIVSFTGAGTCVIDADQAGDTTWAPAPRVTQSFAVGVTTTTPPTTLPTLTVTADSKSRPFGVANPALTATISGFVNGQTLETSGVTGSPACTTTATLVSPAGSYPITCDISTLASGAYGFAFVPGTLTILRGASSVTLSTTTTVFETSTPVTYTAAVEAGVTGALPSGSLVFVIDGVAGPAIPLDASGRGSVTVTWTTPGAKSVEVSYAGDGSFAASGTASAAPSVVANTARATGVGVSAATFYPIADGWRDAVTARGTRLEPLSVTITVKNALGAVVRTFAVPKAAGPYAWAWNGRRSNGAALPAGRYAIVQTLTDPYGSRPRAVTTSSVALSLRRISWSTVIVAPGPGPRCFQFSTGDGVGAYSCGSTGPLRIAGSAGRWPGVGYQFRLPPASGYRSIRIELLGTSTGRRPTVGLHDWTLGSAWGQLYRSGWPRTAIAPTATRWSGVSVADPGSFISGRTVRAYVDGGGRLGGAFAFEMVRVRLVVSVGILQ